MNARIAIGIVGLGWVGSSIAGSVLQAGIANHALLNDLNMDLAEGEAMDFIHGSTFYPAAQVSSASLQEMHSTNAIVIAAGRNSTADQSRLELLNQNAATIAGIAAHFRGYQGTVVVVSNPVDVLTTLFMRHSGLPAGRVIGTGTMLDTARLRQILGSELGVNPRSVHAQIVGEHGDSEVALWSSATIAGMPLRQWAGWSSDREKAVAERVRTAAYEIIRRKGATNHAIGQVTTALLRAVLRDERRVLTVSSVHTPGSSPDVKWAYSLPSIVDSAGISQVIHPTMDEAEELALERSIGVIGAALRQNQP